MVATMFIEVSALPLSLEALVLVEGIEGTPDIREFLYRLMSYDPNRGN